VLGAPAPEQIAFGQLIDHARSVRGIDPEPPRELLQRDELARLEPPQQFGLRIREADAFETRRLVAERAGEQVHQ
jgi:hypothetical protein